MSIEQAARAAVPVFGRDLAVTMVAIAGAESGWRPDARGDHLNLIQRLYNEGRTSKAALDALKAFNCEGYGSFGLWQIYIPFHHSRLAAIGAPAGNPCALAAWLSDPSNNARAALEIYRAQGLGAWTVYRSGAYRQHLQAAAAAVQRVAQADAPAGDGSPVADLAGRAAAWVRQNPEAAAVGAAGLLLLAALSAAQEPAPAGGDA